MTDKQLTLLIRAWTNRLEREIDLLRQGLPVDSERITERRYIGEEPPLFSLKGRDMSPESWVSEPTGDYVLLEGLTDLLTELRESIADLSGIEQAVE